MSKKIIIILFLCLTLFKGFEFFSLWVVSLGYIKWVSDILNQIDALQGAIDRIKLPCFIKDRINNSLAGLIIDGVIILIIQI